MSNEFFISELRNVVKQGSPTCSVENVIIDLIRNNDIPTATMLAGKLQPSSVFAQIFAEELLAREDYSSFFEFQKVSGVPMTSEQADIILRSYIGGKNSSFILAVPQKVLEIASLKVMVLFYDSVLNKGTANSMNCAKKYWKILSEKIEENIKG